MSLAEWYSPYADASRITVQKQHFRYDVGFLPRVLNGTDYDGVFVLRPDVTLKPLFARALANADRSCCLLYSFQTWLISHRSRGGHDRVAGNTHLVGFSISQPKMPFQHSRYASMVPQI